MKREAPPWFWWLAGASALGFGSWIFVQFLFPPDSEENLMALPVPSNTASGLVSKVMRRERAAGVHQKLQAFLDWWDSNGPFSIMVGVDGGVRTLATQAKLYAQGRFTPGPNAGKPGHPLLGDTVTNAESNSSSAHGHGGALDLWPVINGRGQTDAQVPGVAEMYHQIGVAAKSQGLQWGGDWTKEKNGISPDLPHVQVPEWRSLPA